MIMSFARIIYITVPMRKLVICFPLSAGNRVQKQTNKKKGLLSLKVTLERFQLLSTKHLYYWLVFFVISVTHCTSPWHTCSVIKRTVTQLWSLCLSIQQQAVQN